MVCFAPRKIVRYRNGVRVGLDILSWTNAREHGNAFGFVTRRTTQQESAHEAEHRGIDADAEGQSKHGNCCEARVLTELTKTVAAIGKDRAQPVAEALFADLFFELFDAA